MEVDTGGFYSVKIFINRFSFIIYKCSNLQMCCCRRFDALKSLFFYARAPPFHFLNKAGKGGKTNEK